MKRLPVTEFDHLLAYVKANYRPVHGDIQQHGIETTENGLIQHDKDIAKLIGLTPATFSRLRNGKEPMPAKAAAALLRLFGLETPDAIDTDNPGHDVYRKLLLAPVEQFFTELRAMGADVPSMNPSLGEPWAQLVRIAATRQRNLGGSVSLRRLDRAPEHMMPPIRGIPLGVTNPLPPQLNLEPVPAGTQFSYTLNLGSFAERTAGPVHLWAFHIVSGTGQQQYVPLLPAPWSREEYEGPTKRTRSRILEIPERPDSSRCLVVPSSGWGPTVELCVVVTRQPIAVKILQACRASSLIAPETLDQAATLLLDEHDWPMDSWMLLRKSYAVASGQE